MGAGLLMGRMAGSTPARGICGVSPSPAGYFFLNPFYTPYCCQTRRCGDFVPRSKKNLAVSRKGVAGIMLRDTHIAAGVSAALLVVRPQGLLPAAVTVLSAACGADISDIDADRSWARKKADVVTCIATASMAAFAMFMAVSGEFEHLTGMTRTAGAAGIIGKLASWILAAIICTFGMKTGHRHFMHSITASAMLTACVYGAASMQAASAFLAGFLSHLALDLLNHRNLQLLWPVKKGICLHVCSSDGIANRVLGEAFLVTAVLLFDACSGLGLCRYIESLAGQG